MNPAPTADTKGTTLSPLLAFLERHRLPIQIYVDSVAWGLSLVFATILRYDFDVESVDFPYLVAILPLAAGAQTVAGLMFGLYVGRWRFGSFEEVAALVRVAVLTTAALYLLNVWVGDPQLVPRSAVIAAGLSALMLMGALRYSWRLVLEYRRRPRGHTNRLVVFGAGEAGEQIITAMLRDPASPYLPVALLDDDPSKRNLRIRGVPVTGTRAHLADTTGKCGADTLLIAIPNADGALVRDLSQRADAAGVSVKVLPRVSELVGGVVEVGDIRDLTEADLLGRHEVELDLTAAEYITGRRILVTGAGGSIGSELCRQIHRLAPEVLLMADRDESALHAVQLSIRGRAELDSPDLALLDIRDQQHVARLLAEHRPDVVFHAAALKHVAILERQPGPAIEVNLRGTLHLLEAAAEAGVQRFVNISTDKAADPASVLGYTKRVAERLTAHMATMAGGTFVSVRFGNVLGSRGSMLETFHAQVAAGGPITVTHPDVTRYFMTVEEAVRLVLQAGAVGRTGEVLVLDMGEPVRIDDIARRLAATADRPIEIVYTGLRPGEKLHETLFGADEVDARPLHPKVSHVIVPPLDPGLIAALDGDLYGDHVSERLRELARAPAPSAGRTYA